MNEVNASANVMELRERLQNDAGIYSLLARLWIHEVDQSLLEELCNGKLREPYLAVGGYVPSQPDQATVEQLAIEFCACFLGPKGHLPPYQSIVQESNFQSTCVESMRTYIDVIGQPEGIFGGQKMIDHAGLQLSLMQSICLSADQATDEEVVALLEIRDCFYRDHLSWIRDYCAVAVKKTSSKFYSALFGMTAAFLEAGPGDGCEN